MGWCKNCKYEYEAHIKVCSECGDELLDTLEDKVEAKNFDEQNSDGVLDIESKVEYLVTVNNDVEAEALIALLDYNGIKSYKNAAGAGSYLTIAYGFNNTQGIKIYVLETDLNIAQDIMDEYKKEPNEVEADTSLVEQEHSYMKRRTYKTRLVLVMFLAVPIAAVLIMNLINWFMGK